MVFTYEITLGSLNIESNAINPRKLPVSENGKERIAYEQAGLPISSLLLVFHLIYVSVFSFGTAVFSPSVTALVTKHGGNRLGMAFGFQNTVNSLGQTGGPFLGAVLLGWNIHVPYLLAALPLILVGVFSGKGIKRFSILLRGNNNR